jgi:sialate O-acetylesterase
MSHPRARSHSATTILCAIANSLLVVANAAHTEGGLQPSDGGTVKGFVVACADRAWKPAQARIGANVIIVSAPDVLQPAAARCAWAADPVCNLRNGAGLPAPPFRTDDWPLPLR